MASKPNPFAKFEKSKADKEPKGMREGSKREERHDSKLMGKKSGAPMKKAKC